MVTIALFIIILYLTKKNSLWHGSTARRWGVV